MDCVRPSDLKDIMAQMDQYEAELEQDIYTFNGGVIDSSAPPLFDQCAPAFGGLINPYNLSRNLAELQAGNSNSCDSAASSEDWRTSNSVNSNDGVQDAAMNPCAAVQAAPPPNYVTASPAMADQGPHASEDGGFGNSGTTAASMAAMREMIFRVAAMQPINIDPETIKRPKRRNVRISKDPLSVAARHRRERISERIRILQRLVPGGTKMDTASMLDEAIHYVKFLKRQVQALEAAAAAGGHFNYPNHNPGLNFSAFSSSPFGAPHFLAAGPNNSSSLRICNTRLM